MTEKGGTWNNYEKIYDEDDCLKELNDDARLGRVANDETNRIDTEMVNDWTKSLDTLLLFVSKIRIMVDSHAADIIASDRPPFSPLWSPRSLP